MTLPLFSSYQAIRKQKHLNQHGDCEHTGFRRPEFKRHSCVVIDNSMMSRVHIDFSWSVKAVRPREPQFSRPPMVGSKSHLEFPQPGKNKNHANSHSIQWEDRRIYPHFPTFTLTINHSCRKILPYMVWYEMVFARFSFLLWWFYFLRVK